MQLTRRTAGLLTFLLAAALPALGQNVAAPAASQPGGPRLKLDKEKLDFGSLWYGDPCEMQLGLTNVGSAPLEISELKTSCGCTAAKLEQTTLQPGQTEQVRITYDTKKGVRDVSQNVTIISNDAAQRERHIPIVGTVKNVYDGKPSNYVVLGMVPFDRVTERSIELEGNMDEKVMLNVGKLPDDTPFTVRLDPIEEGRRYRMVVTTKPPMKTGPINVKVPLSTTSLRFPTLTISVNGQALDRVAVIPERIGLVPRNDKPTRRMVMVNHLPDSPLNVTGVESSDPSVTTSMGPKASTPPNSAYEQQQIYVNLPAFNELPDSGVVLRILTDDRDPRFQQFEVRIYKQNVAPKAVGKPG